MSAGAVFNLILNDGKADRLIMATKLLNTRLREIMCARKDKGMADITPTLLDIERSHVLYVNAHFKPFCAIAFEYDKVRPNSGVTALSSTVTFAIPTFGDFFHDMVCYIRLGSITSPDMPGVVRGATTDPVANVWPADGNGTFYQIVDAFGNVLGDKTTAAGSQSGTYKNLVRYCEFPGNRLFKRVNFQVNGNPLDEYYDYTVAMLEKFCVPPNKRTGYNRLVGQESVLEGYSGPILSQIHDSDSQNDQYPAIGGQAQTQTIREKRSIVAGYQTPKATQPVLEVWNKLRFWFNEDVRLSVPSVSIPYGNRWITIDLQDQSNLVYQFPGAYLKTIQFSSVPQSYKTGQNLDNAIKQLVTYKPIAIPANSTLPEQRVEFIELYVNNVFVNAEIHDIYIKRIGFSLIRVFRHNVTSVNQENAQSIRMDNLKWPIEYMFTGVRPTWNIKQDNPNQWRDWHRMTRLIDATYGQKHAIEVASGTDGGIAAVSVADNIVKDSYAFPIDSIDSITVTSHAISIYDDYSTAFFHSYLPYHYGGPALSTPEDSGALFINFALFPRSYQPSGHFNMSRARETFIGFTSSYISPTTPADLIVVAVAINFLLISLLHKLITGGIEAARPPLKRAHELTCGFVTV